jgi:hypothetical protein
MMMRKNQAVVSVTKMGHFKAPVLRSTLTKIASGDGP